MASGRFRHSSFRACRDGRRYFQGSINGGQAYTHEILIEGMSIGRFDLAGRQQ